MAYLIPVTGKTMIYQVGIHFLVLYNLALKHIQSMLHIIKKKKWKTALLSSNLPSVIDRSHLSPSREAARWQIRSVDDTRNY